MHEETYHLDPALIQTLRHLAGTTETPSMLLSFLREQIDDKELFAAYLIEAFVNQDMWTIATRWWRGAYPGTRADTILKYTLKETEHLWKT